MSSAAPVHPAVSSLVKRGLDVVGALTLLALAWPVLVIAALAVTASLGRPIFFRQSRPGRGGIPFDLVKLRTMKPHSGTLGQSSDEINRLTRTGELLRSTSIDELPELWNVLRGEMSLVGPRPLLVAYLDRYSPEQARRHEVRPGITGLAQVNGRNAIGWEERLRLDVWYVDHWSLGLDLRILLRTIGNVLRREGVRPEGRATMEEFRGSKGA